MPRRAASPTPTCLTLCDERCTPACDVFRSIRTRRSRYTRRAAAERRSRSARRSRSSTPKSTRWKRSGARSWATRPCLAACRIIISTACCFACCGRSRRGGLSIARSVSIRSTLQARLAQCGAADRRLDACAIVALAGMTGFAALTPAPRAFFSSGGPLAAETARNYARSVWRGADRSLRQHGDGRHCVASAGPARMPGNRLPGIDIRRDADGALQVRSPHLGHDDWHRTDDAIAFDADGRFRLPAGWIASSSSTASACRCRNSKRVSRCIRMSRARPSCRSRSAARASASARWSRSPKRAMTRSCAIGRVALAKALRRHLAGVLRSRRAAAPLAFSLPTLPFDARGKLPAAAIAAAFDARAGRCRSAGRSVARRRRVALSNCACRRHSCISPAIFPACRSCRASSSSTGRCVSPPNICRRARRCRVDRSPQVHGAGRPGRAARV